MRLIPPHPGDEVNRGERYVFDALAASAAAPEMSGWTVLHSLDIAQHRRQVQGEADFVFIVPGKGVLVLEVKGVKHVARPDGVWVYGDGPDARRDPRGPFKQASEAMHSLRDRLVRQRPHLRGVSFGSAVCFPFHVFNDTSVEWHSWQVLDEKALTVAVVPVVEAVRQSRVLAEVRSSRPP